MIDEWRIILYLLGVVPSFFFATRFLIQWIKSEKEKRSYVDPLFWKLSLCGNFIYAIHFIIQVQFPFAMIQTGNAVIAWRNLNLMQGKQKAFSKKSVILIFIGAFLLTIIAFLYQSYFIIGSLDLMRVPTKYWDAGPAPQFSWAWHAVGCCGELLFASRFWIQWLQAEKDHKSTLGRNFWLLSIFGNTLSLTYFLGTGDVVGIMNNSFGLVPYLRNLILITNQKRTKDIKDLKDLKDLKENA